jgi:hypothetical protein
MTDAKFSDADEMPLRLIAETEEDLKVVSALLQDAVTRVGDIAWMKSRRRAALFVNRFRWEDAPRAKAAGRPFERVRAVLLAAHVTAVRALGVDPSDPGMVLSVLSLAWEKSNDDPEDPSGALRITLAGDGEILIEAEYFDVRLEDVTRPYIAPSGKLPGHQDD